MGYRKGKARQRVKDWEQRSRRHDQASDAVQSQSLLKREVKLPASRQADLAAAEELAGTQRVEGMVTGLSPAGVYVRVGGEEILCRIAGTFRSHPGTTALAVGDEVAIARVTAQHLSGKTELDKQRSDGVILSRQIRRSALARPLPISSKRRNSWDEELFEKVVAANMDVLLVVASMRQPALRPGLIDRFCIMAEKGKLLPMVVFNKIDLAAPPEDMLAELAESGVPTIQCSAVTRAGLDELLAAIAGRRSVLAGPSGVGKSSLVNALVPGANVLTREIRAKDDRGRHVTAATVIYELPAGGFIVDTPGVRELALEMEANELPWYFPDIVALTGGCKFNDCSHTHEPHCAVRAAAESGALPPRRYARYLRILETILEER